MNFPTIEEKQEWQFVDESLRIMYPYYTYDAIKEIESWDLKNKMILEFGAGLSTVWFAAKGAFVFSIETNKEWASHVRKELFKMDLFNANIFYVDVEIASFGFYRLLCPKYDIVIVDGVLRDEVIENVLESIDYNFTLIVDNWLQPSVGVATEETQRLLSPYPVKIYKQNGHPDWQTAIFEINDKR